MRIWYYYICVLILVLLQEEHADSSMRIWYYYICVLILVLLQEEHAEQKQVNVQLMSALEKCVKSKSKSRFSL
jgi:hypothetical protein